MNLEQDDFKRLRQLLALKRHEQPPPGYFSDFSGQVINQIVSGRNLNESSAAESLGWEAPWLLRLWAAFENKPAFAGAFGVAVCALLISGIVYSERTASGSLADLPPMPEPAVAPVVLVGGAPMTHSPLAQSVRLNVSSTEGFATAPARLSLFQEIKERPKLWLPEPEKASLSSGN